MCGCDEWNQNDEDCSVPILSLRFGETQRERESTVPMMASEEWQVPVQRLKSICIKTSSGSWEYVCRKRFKAITEAREDKKKTEKERKEVRFDCVNDESASCGGCDDGREKEQDRHNQHNQHHSHSHNQPFWLKACWFTNLLCVSKKLPCEKNMSSAVAKTMLCAPVANASAFSTDSEVADAATSCVPDVAPVLLIEYIAPAPGVNNIGRAPVIECIAPAPVVTHVAPAPKCISPAVYRDLASD